MCKRCPSDVFLELWRARGIQTPEAFRECAEAWLQIRELEMMARISQAGGASPSPTSPPESTPEGVEKVHPARVEKVHGDEPSQAAAPPAPPEGEPSQGVAQNRPDPAKSAAAATGMANRKRNDMARLEALRARGVSMQTVAESAAGLTLNDVLDFLDRKPIQLPKLVALEKAMKKLEVSLSDGAERRQLSQGESLHEEAEG